MPPKLSGTCRRTYVQLVNHNTYNENPGKETLLQSNFTYQLNETKKLYNNKYTYNF